MPSVIGRARPVAGCHGRRLKVAPHKEAMRNICAGHNAVARLGAPARFTHPRRLMTRTGKHGSADR